MSEVTRLLQLARDGGSGANDQLLSLVYDELRQLAASQMRHESAGQTLQPTALVHEAYLRLVGTGAPQWENSSHFFGAAAEAMRRILSERARRRNRVRHGGGRERVDFDRVQPLDFASDPAVVLALDDAMRQLGEMDQRLCELVKLRCFLGMTIAQASQALGVSSRTLNRDWIVARAWLRNVLSGDMEQQNSTDDVRSRSRDGACLGGFP